MHWLSTIKFPAVPGCWNYKMMRSHWVKTWCKIIQAGITNAVAPQISVKRNHSSLPTNNTSTSSRWERPREWLNTPSKKPHSKHLKFDKDVGTIRQGYLSDNAVKCSLKKKDKVYIMNLSLIHI